MKRTYALFAAGLTFFACETQETEPRVAVERVIVEEEEEEVSDEKLEHLAPDNAATGSGAPSSTDLALDAAPKTANNDDDSATKGVVALGDLKGTASGEVRGHSGYGLGGVSLGERRAGRAVEGGRTSTVKSGSQIAMGRGVGGGGAGYGKGVGSTARLSLGATVVRAPRDDTGKNTESYKDHGTNKFTDASEDRFSTFAVDVDTGSYTIARRKLDSGQLPPTASVRVEEFLNYFRYDYPKPDSGAFGVSMEAAPSPFSTDGATHLFRVGVQGKTILERDRKPVHLTFLVDVSGSMQSDDKIGLVKKSLHVLTDNLHDEDTVAIATYAGRTEVVLEPTGLDRRQQIFNAIDRLGAGGSTAMSSGLDLAYGLAAKNLQPAHETRVIVLSDGDANVGRTGWEPMLKQIGGEVKKGITLSTIGFGMGNYKDTLMEQLANHGNGNYYYVDSEKEAQRIFGDQLDGTLQVIAKDVKIQVDFNPDAVYRYRLLGYENRDVADKDFRNDKVDAGEIGAGHTVTALYEVELKEELPETIATVRVRHKEPRGSDKASERTFVFASEQLGKSISASSRDFQFAAAVAALAEKLRNSPYAEKLTYDWILEIAEGATEGRADRQEFVGLVKKARRAS